MGQIILDKSYISQSLDEILNNDLLRGTTNVCKINTSLYRDNWTHIHPCVQKNRNCIITHSDNGILVSGVNARQKYDNVILINTSIDNIGKYYERNNWLGDNSLYGDTNLLPCLLQSTIYYNLFFNNDFLKNHICVFSKDIVVFKQNGNAYDYPWLNFGVITLYPIMLKELGKKITDNPCDINICILEQYIRKKIRMSFNIAFKSGAKAVVIGNMTYGNIEQDFISKCIISVLNEGYGGYFNEIIICS